MPEKQIQKQVTTTEKSPLELALRQDARRLLKSAPRVSIYQTLTGLAKTIGASEGTIRNAIDKAHIERSGGHGQLYDPHDVSRMARIRAEVCGEGMHVRLGQIDAFGVIHQPGAIAR